MLLIEKIRTNLPPSKKINRLPINLIVELGKLLNSVSVEIVVLLTTSLQIVLPTNVTDARNLVILLSNVLNKPQSVLPALPAITPTIYIETVPIMSAEDAVH